MPTKFSIIQPGEYIGKCSEMLPNGFQCTRAGEFHILKPNESEVEGEHPAPSIIDRQVCKAHAIAIRSREQQEAEGKVNIPNLSVNEVLLERLNAETPAEQELKSKLTEQSEVNNEQSKPTESGATT